MGPPVRAQITSWHADEGISGSNGLDSRDGLPDATAEVRDGRAAGLMIYRLDWPASGRLQPEGPVRRPRGRVPGS